MFVNFFAETINKIYSLNKKEDDIDHVEYIFKNTTCRDEFEIFKKSMMMFYDNNYKDAFEIDTTLDINIKYDSSASRLNTINLRLESTIVQAFIYLLVFDEIVVLYVLFKLLTGDEVVLFAMLLLPTWSASGGRDGEFVLSWIGFE